MGVPATQTGLTRPVNTSSSGAASTSYQLVQLRQIQGSSQPTTAPVIPARIYSNIAQVGNAGTGSEDLKTFTNGFTAAAGDSFDVHIWGKLAANGNNKVYSLTSSVGYTLTSGTVTYNALSFDIRATLARIVGGVSMSGGSIQTTGQATVANSVASTWTALVVSATVQGAAASDILIFGMTVDYYPALV